MPPQLLIQILLLAVLGALTGSLINWAIYRWAITRYLPVSPFMKRVPDQLREQHPDYVAENRLDEVQPRAALDFVPIVGWFRLRRDASVFGKACWLRPLLIELTWMIGLPLFFLWQHNGGLIGFDPAVGLTPADADQFASLANGWFWLHSILIALMFIATFIDFDEQMIPDQVTVPGTLVALIASAIFINVRLPLTVPTPAALRSLSSIDFASPDVPGAWVTSTTGLLACVAIFVIWVLALLPKIYPPREFGLGHWGSLKIMLASTFRPRRKNECELRVRPRTTSLMTRIYLLMLFVGVILLPIAWFSWLGMAAKISLVSSFIGLGVAGGLIWGIRIVGGVALGQEAMGFGDVTLMCMIGAFLGWQASMAGFVYSIFFAVVLAIILFVMTKKSYLAFGPYLCMGSLLAMFRWPSVWSDFEHIFWMGPWLLAAFGGSLVLMAILLPLVRWLKESLLGVDLNADETA
ncbi:prepilin peptidase [Mariniblastus fucicola]|uniref:Type IV leader peptidase family protein n=1 Tax=Mariniblastus fucicola TaxID=980251 RepID=A0A5B9PI68_9BACT|nr:A24 family peptidase [Mariniblastus fucicola]QEG24366.1 Type IV leader peptidase family protein [Mariniblastus fucicola]